MPNLPCEIGTPCINPANPITNYSSEKPDKEVFLGFSSGSPLNAPDPGHPYDNPDGYYYCSDGTSVESAADCANNGAPDNGVDGGGTSNDPPPNTGGDPGVHTGSSLFWNTAQSASVTCPDGGTFTYTMPANTVHSTNPVLVDQIAASIAVSRANKYLICISSISGACLGDEYDHFITATTNTAGDVDWQLRSGTLPPGLAVDFDLFDTKKISLAGTPTATGNYTFVIRATDSLGNYTDKTFTLAVLGFTNSPSGATVGTPYSFQFTAAGGVAPYSLSVPPGHLPTGLTMSESGLITGTPTEDVPTTFTVTLEDDSGNQCGKQFTMTPVQFSCITNTTLNTPLGVDFSIQLLSTFGTAPRTFAVTSGSPPSQVSLSADGILSGIPDTQEVSEFEVTVTDSNLNTCASQITMTITGCPFGTRVLTTGGFVPVSSNCNFDLPPAWDHTLPDNPSCGSWSSPGGVSLFCIPNTSAAILSVATLGWNSGISKWVLEIQGFRCGAAGGNCFWFGYGPSDPANPIGTYTVQSQGQWAVFPPTVTVSYY